MPQVVPSQVVDVIDKLYVWAKDFKPGTGGDLPPTDASKLRGIISMIDEIPPELLDVSGEDYGALLIARADVEGVIAQNLARGGSHYFPWTVPVNLRAVLAKCPDEFPPAAFTDLSFIPDADLRSSIRGDIAAAERAFANTEWKAATVLGGSTIEALLLWAIGSGPKADLIAARAAITAANGKPRHDHNWWDLGELIPAAQALGVITSGTVAEVTLAKGFRNLIHPGRANRLGQKCDRGTAHLALAALDHVVRDLA